MIIDAENLIIGRIGTVAAKKALLGEKVVVVNCEKAVITGKKEDILAKYKARVARGQPRQGPFIPRRPDMFIRRLIRGMLPHKQDKGKKAFQNVMCYMGIPEEFKDKTETIEGANISKIPNLKYVVVKDLCKQMGANNG